MANALSDRLAAITHDSAVVPTAPYNVPRRR
jgi:hypothetical protein